MSALEDFGSGVKELAVYFIDLVIRVDCVKLWARELRLLNVAKQLEVKQLETLKGNQGTLVKLIKQVLTCLLDGRLTNAKKPCKALGPRRSNLLLSASNYIKQQGAMLIETV